MRSPWRSFSFLAALLLAVPLGIFGPVRLHAQTPFLGGPQVPAPSAGGQRAPAPGGPADDMQDDDEQPVSSFSVRFVLDATGKTEAQAFYFLLDEPKFPAPKFRDLLQSALGCSLRDSSPVRPAPGFYSGTCNAAPSRQGFLRQGRIVTLPLQDFARLHSVTYSSIQLQLPDSDVTEANLPAQHAFAPASKVPVNIRRRSTALFISTWSADKPLPPEIVYRYGYATSALERRAGILLLVVLSPLVLFLWLGRRALSADVPDKAVVWFSYMRSLHWILNGSLLGWWIALDYCKAEATLRFLSSGTRFAALAAHPAAYEAFSWVPPAMIWILCYRISHPVQQKLRGLRWTRRELTLQAVYSAFAGLFPFALFLTGLRVLGTGGLRGATSWWLAAVLLRVFAAQALLKLTGMQPQALSSGDLRDRAFAMAATLGVKLKQIYLIPSGKGQVANAFAHTANTVSFTDFLLQRMSQREVDYVMGHELTHLKLKHPAKLGYAYMAGMFLSIFLMTVAAPYLHGSAVARYALMFTIISAFPYFWSRRFEYAADAGAVAATGDPRAAISALFKLSELNMTPVHWSKWREKWLSHPSSMRRAQAIAKKAAIPFEEIPAIAREGAQERQSYSVPSSAAAGAKVHSTQRTKSLSNKLGLILIAVLTLIPSLLSLAAIHAPAPMKWTLFAAAFPATLLFFLLFSNYSPRLARGTVVSSLNKKLASEGVQSAPWSGVFVGYSPGATLRLYEGNANWDIGYLFFRSDRICYYGEEAKFALRQNQITSIKLTSGLPSLIPNQRIYVAWKDDERGTCGVFNLACGQADSMLHARKITADLARRLEAWCRTAPVARPLPPQLADLTSPEVRAVTSQSLAERRKPQKVFNELFATAICAAVCAGLCGLPFHVVQSLLFYSSSRAPIDSGMVRAGMPNLPPTPGAGWYVVGVAVLVRLVTLFPLFFYRDAPQLKAETPTKRASAPVAAAVGEGQPTGPSLEKLPVS